MNAKENFENKELPVKDDNSNVTPVSDDAKKEFKNKEKEEDSIKQEEPSSESTDDNNDAPDTTPKDDPGLDHSTSVDPDVVIHDETESEEESD